MRPCAGSPIKAAPGDGCVSQKKNRFALSIQMGDNKKMALVQFDVKVNKINKV